MPETETKTRDPRSLKATAGSVAASNGFLALVLTYGPAVGIDLVAATGVPAVAIIALWNAASAPLGTLARDFAHEFQKAGKTLPWWARPFVRLFAGWIG